jgi:hypothetical protein
MALPINAVFPAYANSSNYSGVNGAVHSAGLVNNVEQAEAVASAQRDGRLGLSQFAFIKIPREVLFLQDEKTAKLKSSSVASSTKSDFDDERLLNKVENPHSTVTAIDGREGRTDGDKPENPEGQDQAAAQPKEAPHDVATPGVLGTGSSVYQGVIAANHASLSGRNLSVLA